MLSFDATTTTSLAGATDKTDWANRLANALGTPRVLRCKRDANAAAADVWTTGTEFLNAPLTGAMSISNGVIASVGVVGTPTTQLAADLTSGASILRITSSDGTRWAQGTLGLAGTANDFTFNSNPTTGVGVGVSATTAGPKTLSSGVGPTPPTITNAAPYGLTLEDWRNPAAPVTVGVMYFDTRRDNFTFEDTEIAGEIGDVVVVQTSTPLVLGEFEWGATLLGMSAANNLTDNTKPLWQVLISCKPYKIWPTYPCEDTRLDRLANTIPPPFKFKLRDGNGVLLKNFEMRDGSAINDVNQSQYLGKIENGVVYRKIETGAYIQGGTVETAAARPFFNCAMMLPWQSGRTKVSSLAPKFFNGMLPDAIRASQNKAAVSLLADIPVITLGAITTDKTYSPNSLNHWFALPRWPLVSDASGPGAPEVLAATYPHSTDPWLFSDGYHNYEGRVWHYTGWDYEPGSVSGHDWYMGPGGPRSDRAPSPTPLAIFQTNPNYVRPYGNVPIRDLCDAWGLAYFNHACHYVLDETTFAGFNFSEVAKGDYAYMSVYYGFGPFKDLKRSIHLLAPANQAPWGYKDKNNRRAWNGWAMDPLHTYGQPGWWTLIFNSPMHTVGSRFRTAAVIMCQMGATAPDGQGGAEFLHRQRAWRFLNYVFAWKLASKHSLGVPRDVIEQRLKAELEYLWENIYKPCMIENDQSLGFQTLRNLGMWSYDHIDGSTRWAYLDHDSKAFYLAHTIVLWKQTGLWARAKSLSTKCSELLGFLVRCLDIFGLENIMATNGRFEGIETGSPVGSSATPPVAYASFADMAQQNPAVGLEDWIRDVNGTISRDPKEWARDYQNTNTRHFIAQWAFARRDYFSEYGPNTPNGYSVAAAVAKFQGYYDAVAASVDGTNASNTNSFDWRWRIPPMGFLAPPPTGLLGPS